jgi:hypothetical protein
MKKDKIYKQAKTFCDALQCSLQHKIFQAHAAAFDMMNILGHVHFFQTICCFWENDQHQP